MFNDDAAFVTSVISVTILFVGIITSVFVELFINGVLETLPYKLFDAFVTFCAICVAPVNDADVLN